MLKTHLASKIIKTEPIKWRELKFIQDDDFKEWINDGDKKLQESIIKYQFIDPFKVWENDGNIYCLDGKHRWKDLQIVAESGIEIPELLPGTFIDCADIKEAAELVLVYSSAYARITAEGMFNFIKKFELDFEPLKGIMELPGLDLSILDDRFLPMPIDLVGLSKNKPIMMNITFKSKQDLEEAELQIKDLLKVNWPDAFYSVSAGEL